MAKLLKKLLFWLFIMLAVVLMGYLGVIAYTDANCTRGINYLTSKYEIKSNDIRCKKYQEYVYEDIANCDSLWLKKCTSDERLVYEYTLEDNDGNTIVIKEYKDGSFSDNYEKGKIKKEYLDKINKENSTVEETPVEAN
jgi:hypothetical protein